MDLRERLSDRIHIEDIHEILRYGKNKNIDFVCITAGGVTGTLKAIKESERNIKVGSFDDTETTRKAMLDVYKRQDLRKWKFGPLQGDEYQSGLPEFSTKNFFRQSLYEWKVPNRRRFELP